MLCWLSNSRLKPEVELTMEVNRSQPLKGVQVLLVEDEADIASLLIFVLQEAGATVTLCESAETALSVLEVVRPNILVSNIRLPQQDGAWLIRQIHNHPRPDVQQIPLIAVTSYTREFAASQAILSGFDFFLPKLESPNILIGTIFTFAKLSSS